MISVVLLEFLDSKAALSPKYSVLAEEKKTVVFSLTFSSLNFSPFFERHATFHSCIKMGKKGRWQRCFDYDVSDVYVKGDNVVIGLDCDTSLSVVDKFLEKIFTVLSDRKI